jgi:hypothetical protein
VPLREISSIYLRSIRNQLRPLQIQQSRNRECLTGLVLKKRLSVRKVCLRSLFRSQDNSGFLSDHHQCLTLSMEIWCNLQGYKYRAIHKFLRDFRPLRYSSRIGHAEGEHVNRERERERDTPSFCPTLQVLDMSTLGDAADVNPLIKFLPHTLQHLAVEGSDCLHDPFSQL